MKTYVLVLLGLLAWQALPAQQAAPRERTALTLGILQGGGALVGADLEVLLTRRLGLQVGGGISAYGGAITYHLRPDIRSSHLALTYWHQGFGVNFAQEALGTSYIYRSRKGFTAQIGLARVLSRGPAWPDSAPTSPVILLYSIGWSLVQ